MHPKFSFKDFFSKYAQIRKKIPDLVTFTEETLNGKLLMQCTLPFSTFP